MGKVYSQKILIYFFVLFVFTCTEVHVTSAFTNKLHKINSFFPCIVRQFFIKLFKTTTVFFKITKMRRLKETNRQQNK